MGCRELPSIDPRPTEGRLSSPRYDRTLALAGIAFALLLAPLLGALAQDASKPDATFNERYPGQQPSAQGTPDQNVRQRAPESAPRTAAVNGERNLARPVRVASTKRPRSRVVVVPRSFLDAGTEVLPGERKFLDYALPPTHTPLEVVQNTGGRVGWHRSPLPGPFFPTRN